MSYGESGFGVDLWRFIAGIGIGVELVTDAEKILVSRTNGNSSTNI